ncbi:hypothetical protein B0H10DRAFT_2018424 [Mycena sp. CBHHK59/15]|nr:hypothetical protein B0H10DRAFT_2018424 [Mycena sp. CBHHK59/15]
MPRRLLSSFPPPPRPPQLRFYLFSPIGTSRPHIQEIKFPPLDPSSPENPSPPASSVVKPSFALSSSPAPGPLKPLKLLQATSSLQVTSPPPPPSLPMPSPVPPQYSLRRNSTSPLSSKTKRNRKWMTGTTCMCLLHIAVLEIAHVRDAVLCRGARWMCTYPHISSCALLWSAADEVQRTQLMVRAT